VENRGRQKERGKSSRNRGKSKHDISKSKGRIECWNCGKQGYVKKYFWSQKGKEGNENKRKTKKQM